MATSAFPSFDSIEEFKKQNLIASIENAGPRFVDLTSKHFGSVKVLGPAGSRDLHGSWVWFWWVECAKCSRVVAVQGKLLRRGSYQSCGCARTAERFPNKLAAKKHLYRSYKGKALERSYSFRISFKDFLNLVESPCHYCGTAPNTNRHYRSGEWMAGGIDRVDNRAGYTPSNCVPCCERCNRMKGAMNRDYFLERIHKIARAQFG